MPRGNRIFFENAHYHVTCRGNDKRDIFTDLQDRSHYVTLLQSVVQEFGLIIPAFALMTNHIHLYIVTPKANLAEAMLTLNSEYSHKFNKRHGTTGHVFEGRYKHKLIQSERYSLALARYIHLNPVKAGLAAKAEDYPWSSAADYEGRGAFSFVNPRVVLDPLSEDPAAALEIYREFMAEPPEKHTTKFWGNFDKGRNMVLGDKEFKRLHSPHPDKEE